MAWFSGIQSDPTFCSAHILCTGLVRRATLSTWKPPYGSKRGTTKKASEKIQSVTSHSQHFPTGPNHSFFMVFTLEISPRQTRCTWTPRGSCHCSTEITLVLSVAVGYVRCVVFGFVSCRDDCCASSLWRELNSSFLSSKSKIIRKISWFHPTDSVDSVQCPSGQ